MKPKSLCIRRLKFWSILRFIPAIVLIAYMPLEASFVRVGAGGYTTDHPAGMTPSNQNNQPITPRVTSQFNKPIQTNDWWTSLLWPFNTSNAWSENLFAHPLSLKAQTNGLTIGYPTNHFVTPFNPVAQGEKVQEYHYPHVPDLLMGVVGLNSPTTKVSDYSDWSVTAFWSSGSTTMQTTFGSGLPFVYAIISGDAQVNFLSTPTIWSQQNEVIGVTINGHHYGIFAPSGSTWTTSGNSISSHLNGKNYYSLALLPDNQASTLEFFRQHAYAFVTNTQVDWQYDPTHSVVKATYSAQTTLMEPGSNQSNVNHPLMALFKHQWKNSTDPFLLFTYVSSHGLMKTVDATQFTVTLPYNGVLPFLPNFAKDGVNTYSSKQLLKYIDDIYQQSPSQRWQNTNSSTDTYWMGKNLARIAHLIPIADQVQHQAAKDLFLSEVKTQLQNWFSGQTSQFFYYDPTWNTLIGYPASYGSDNQLNDHHFHYGYFIMASSIVAIYDPAWATENQWGGMVEMLIRDVANWDRTDTRFPFLRNFDVYAGHSWAAGPAAFASGNNEESSSEEINFISALIQWGSLTGNNAIRDLGAYLYATATAAIPQYWFNVDHDIFPSDFQPNTLGMGWSDGGAYAIWWAGTAEELHGINFMPIQPGMLYLGKYPRYLQANQAFMLANGGDAHTDVWRDIHMSIKALYDPQDAIAEFNNNVGYTPEAGDSNPHTYHWLHNINQLGAVDPSITADIPTYAVFDQNGVINHVAFNPQSTPITATFSDGVKLAVPPYTMTTSTQSSTHTFTNQTADSGEVTFFFSPNWTPQYVKLNYTINGSSAHTVNMINQNGTWVFNIDGLKNGDVIQYAFVYEDGGNTMTTPNSQHAYQCGETPTPPPTPPPSSVVLDDTADYTLSVQRDSSGVQIIFLAKKQSTFVDLHYQINQGSQLNVRMQQKGNTWTYPINNLKTGDTISCSLTYEAQGTGHNTKIYSYTY
jgi:endoglucanase Acf2